MLVIYSVNPVITNEALNRLFAESWADHQPVNFEPILTRSLVYICGYFEHRLVGYVNVAWDGGKHAFLLDVTVHPSAQRNGIGRELVRRATEAAHERGVVWLHVDFEPSLTEFYRGCGFTPTDAGLIRLRE
ncbi:MAG: GNAT family N-acetyltransferase [Anaerolineae bacterium]|nr:GNAT family N-acetyltransferase [Anaerolineae bacterium]